MKITWKCPKCNAEKEYPADLLGAPNCKSCDTQMTEVKK